MSLQLIIDIGLFLIYCALFTLLLAWTWKFWMLYVNTSYQKSLKYSLLEIKLPREINKSPEATELFLRSMIEGGGLGNWYKENWKGNMPAVSSVEIASLEGVIHFYVRVEKKLKPRVEQAIYSQYPTVEIIEVEDYTNKLPPYIHNAENKPSFWGTEWVLAKTSEVEVGNSSKDGLDKLEYSGDMYPIKTYKDWGLDKDPKEMYKHDPLTYLIEQFGAMGKGEYMCHQIIFRDAGKWNGIYEIKRSGKKEDGKKLSDLVKIELDKFKTKWSLKKKNDSLGYDEYGNPKMMKVSDGVDENGKPKFKEVEAKYVRSMTESKAISPAERDDEAKKSTELILRKKNKPQVIACMRTLYMAESMGDGRIQIVMNLVSPFNESEGFNTFRPSGVADPYDYPWQDKGKKRSSWVKENLYESYVSRDGLFSLTGGMSESISKRLDYNFFGWSGHKRGMITNIWNILFHPFSKTMNLSGFILSVEELATLYHFPGEVAATPTLPRIDSVKSSSPSNLPTQ